MHHAAAPGPQVQEEPWVLAFVARPDAIPYAQLVRYARLHSRPHLSRRQLIGDARICATAVVIDDRYAGNSLGIKFFHNGAVAWRQGLVEALYQQQIAIAVGSVPRPAFDRAME
jgi:hypothetical protein